MRILLCGLFIISSCALAIAQEYRKVDDNTIEFTKKENISAEVFLHQCDALIAKQASLQDVINAAAMSQAQLEEISAQVQSCQVAVDKTREFMDGKNNGAGINWTDLQDIAR